jgi:lipopolysaccharide export system protein LptA
MRKSILVMLYLFAHCVCGAIDSLPLKIKSNSLNVNYREKIARYQGKVLAVQGDLRINSDVMVVSYKGGSNVLKSDRSSFESILFEKNVQIEQGGNVATGDNAIYREKDKKIFLTGNVMLMQGKNNLRGNAVIYDTKKKFFSVTNGANENKKRVRAVIFD